MGTKTISKTPSRTAARQARRRRRRNVVGKTDAGDAFVADVVRGEGFLSGDSEADAEEFIASITSAGGSREDSGNEFVGEEIGAPFLAFAADADSPAPARIGRTSPAEQPRGRVQALGRLGAHRA